MVVISVQFGWQMDELISPPLLIRASFAAQVALHLLQHSGLVRM